MRCSSLGKGSYRSIVLRPRARRRSSIHSRAAAFRSRSVALSIGAIGMRFALPWLR